SVEITRAEILDGLRERVRVVGDLVDQGERVRIDGDRASSRGIPLGRSSLPGAIQLLDQVDDPLAQSIGMLDPLGELIDPGLTDARLESVQQIEGVAGRLDPRTDV